MCKVIQIAAVLVGILKAVVADVVKGIGRAVGIIKLLAAIKHAVERACIIIMEHKAHSRLVFRQVVNAKRVTRIANALLHQLHVWLDLLGLVTLKECCEL